MIHKTFIENRKGKVARVTFTLPNSNKSESICLVGDFNDWNPTSHPFKLDAEGRWSLTLDLELWRAYQFRYLRNGEEWMYDIQADAFVYNPHGVYNFVIVTDPAFKRYDAV
jgi:1,4-alpha-glucan branching enzyme